MAKPKFRAAGVVVGEDATLPGFVWVRCVTCQREGQAPASAIEGLKPDVDGVYSGLCPPCLEGIAHAE
jgi:hypothetical protein